MIFRASKKITKKMKKGGGGVNKCFRQIGSGPRRAFGVCQVKRIHQSLQPDLVRPVPCVQGAADCYPFGSSADPTFLNLGRLTYAASLNNRASTTSYQNRSKMDQSGPRGEGGEGYPNFNKIIFLKKNANAPKTK